MRKAESIDTETVARRYFDAWTSSDTATVASLLAADFRYRVGDMSVEGKDAFLSAGAFPRDVHTTMVAQAYQGENAIQMYDVTRGASMWLLLVNWC